MSYSVLSIATDKRNQLINISPQINNYLKNNQYKDGIITVFIPHTTAAVTINENADEDVKTDMLSFLNKTIPCDPAFRHFEGNSDSHIKTSLVSPSITILVENGKLVLGTWQSVFFCEFDGPRKRKAYLKFISG